MNQSRNGRGVADFRLELDGLAESSIVSTVIGNIDE